MFPSFQISLFSIFIRFDVYNFKFNSICWSLFKVRLVNSHDFSGILCNFSSNFTFSKFFMLVGTFVLFKIALCYDPYAFSNLTVKIVKGHFCLTIVEDLKLANDRPTFALSNFTFLSAVDLISK